MNGIRIDELTSTVLPSADHEFPAMKDGVTVKLTVAQIIEVALEAGLVKEEDLGQAAFLDVGTDEDTVAAGDDERLSDAREWMADTVSEVDAKAGLSSDRKAWTAERVRQNVEAALGVPKILICTRSVPSITIDKGYGVSSITKLGTGEFRINFSQPFADTNYIFVATAGAGSGVTTARVVAESEDKRLATSTEIQIWGVGATSANKLDYALLSFAIYGD